jgi:long-chain acyl-CoA synthetase
MKRTVVNMLGEAVKQYGESPYVLEKGDNQWLSKSYVDIWNESDYFAAEMLNLGLQKNDKIAVLAEGRMDWVMTEYGILKAGCISVPLSIKLLPEEVLFRLNHSESKLIILSKNTIEKIIPVWNNLTIKNFKIIYLEQDTESIQNILADSPINYQTDIILIKDILSKGKIAFDKNKSTVETSISQIEEEDVVNICYTSGTTGNPKGIMLTHLNYYANSRDAMSFFNVPPMYRLLIILPLDHSFAHTVGIYASLVRGIAIYFVDARGGGTATIRNIPINLKEVNPNFLLTVPALSGNFMNKIIDGINDKGGFVKWLFNKGMNAGMNIYKDGYKKASLLEKIVNYIPYKIADTLIFKKVRTIFGNNLQYCVGGGALLDIRQQRFFYTLGIPIFQGYGLTEATPIISANTPTVHKLGSSGKILPTIKAKIIRTDGSEATTGEKGELVIQGENVMKGYFKNPQATNETIKDGWLYTGDLGYLDTDGFLIITGREKALLISQDGEKYSPEEIEEAIVNCSELISQIMIHNDHSRYTSALITLKSPQIENYCKKHHISKSEELLEVIKKSFYRFKNQSDYANKFPEKWIPSVFRIIKDPFTEQNLMVNSTLKLVRYKIRENFSEVINEMYLPDANTINAQKNNDILTSLYFRK